MEADRRGAPGAEVKRRAVEVERRGLVREEPVAVEMARNGGAVVIEEVGARVAVAMDIDAVGVDGDGGG